MIGNYVCALGEYESFEVFVGFVHCCWLGAFSITALFTVLASLDVCRFIWQTDSVSEDSRSYYTLVLGLDDEGWLCMGWI